MQALRKNRKKTLLFQQEYGGTTFASQNWASFREAEVPIF